MMSRVGMLLALLAFIAYPILLHTYILKDEVEAWRLLFVFAPLLLVTSWIIGRSVNKIWWPLGALLLAALVYYIVTQQHARIGLLAVNGLTHVAFNLFLLLFFGRTLLRGREPLIAQISRRINGSLSPEITVYTRQVTVVWCIFFGGQIIIALLLYVFVSVSAWSFFINVLNMPLLLTLLVGEHLYRRVRFPHHQQTSIFKAMAAYSKNFGASEKTDTKR